MDNWKLFKQKWQDYSILVKLGEQPREYQVALLRQALGDAARRVYNGLSFNTTEEERTTREIITAFDAFAIGEVNETIERYNFNRCVQEEGETFNTFYSAIEQLALTCGYCDNCRDSLLCRTC